ncbi:hypothetical protein [Thiohalocapsa halophila]
MQGEGILPLLGKDHDQQVLHRYRQAPRPRLVHRAAQPRHGDVAAVVALSLASALRHLAAQVLRPVRLEDEVALVHLAEAQGLGDAAHQRPQWAVHLDATIGGMEGPAQLAEDPAQLRRAHLLFEFRLIRILKRQCLPQQLLQRLGHGRPLGRARAEARL